MQLGDFLLVGHRGLEPQNKNSHKNNITATQTSQTLSNKGSDADSSSTDKGITPTLSEHNNNVFLRPDHATAMLIRTVSNKPDQRRIIPIGRAVNLAAIYPQDLTELIHAWPKLPEAIKAGIMAMVKATAQPAPSGKSGPRKGKGDA